MAALEGGVCPTSHKAAAVSQGGFWIAGCRGCLCQLPNPGTAATTGSWSRQSKGFVDVKQRKLDVMPENPWHSISRCKWLPFSKHLNSTYSNVSLKVKGT